jgi:putative transposase
MGSEGQTLQSRDAVVFKAVSFAYTPTPATREVLQTFREMVNEAIRICIEEGIHGRLRLRDRIYKEFKERYQIVSVYAYSVAEVAWSIAKKCRNWHRKPYAKRLMMKMDVQNYSLYYSILSLPFRRGERLLIPLRYGDYQRAFLSDDTLRRGSVTLTESNVIVAFKKHVPLYDPKSRLGIDLNEKSAVCSDGIRYDLAEVARLHAEYGNRRSEFSRNHRDNRVEKRFARTRREKNRVRQLLHKIGKEVVEEAKSKSQSIVLEKLKGIRITHLRGNGEGKGRRRRVSQWPFRMFQAFVLYKANWEGVPVEFVSAAFTSQTCHKCGLVNRKLKLTEREWRCPNCGAILDRDLNAAINIERRGKIACLGEVRPGAQGTDEALKGNPTTPVILRAEALKLTRSTAKAESNRTLNQSLSLVL